MLLAAGATSHSRALWYLTRGSGIVALLLLTASVALGIVESVAWASPRWPRFITAALHKNTSLLATVFLGVHIVTAVADGFAPIGWIDVVVPFRAGYRPLWLGLGAVAVDLLLALVITSLLRQRIGYRAWRAVHWSAYACWPVALLHGLGTGSDTRLGWVVLCNLACLGTVVAAVGWRLVSGWESAGGRRLGAVMAAVVAPIAIIAWMVTQPMRPGWARKAGTPASLLSQAAAAAAPPSSSGQGGGGTPSGSGGAGSSATAGAAAAGATGSNPNAPAFQPPFTATLTGRVNQTPPDANGNTTINIDCNLSNGATGTLQLLLAGTALSDGGVRMSTSRAAMGPPGRANLYQGQITGLEGSRVVATLHDASGRRVVVVADLQIDPQSNTVSGTARTTTGSLQGGGGDD